MKEHIEEIELKQEDASDRTKRHNAVYKLAKHEVNPATSVNVDKT